MNILVASPYLPWPLNAGGRVAQYSSLACLCTDHRFTLVCPVYTEEGLSDAAALQETLPGIKVRAVYCGSLERLSPPGEDILLRSLKWGARQYRKWRSTAPPGTAAQKERPVPAYPFSPLPEAYVAALADELKLGIDLVQVEFAEMLSLGAWLPREIPKVFIHHQLHFVYAERFLTARNLAGYSEYLREVMRVQEKAYLREFDSVVVFSDEDKRALSGWLEDDKVHVSPFPIASGSETRDDSREARFSFVGSEEHFPNRDALEWLTEEIWPEISKQMPGAILRVIGPWGEASRARHSKPGVEFTGFVADLENAIGGSVMLVPLRIGSGIRVKLLDAMAQGAPAVSTSIGCEGIPVADGINILIRDDASAFAAAAVELLNNSKLRTRLASAGKDLVAKYYSPDRVRKRRNEIYRAACMVNSQCASESV
jgi:glycosyltransferase involved in cell wall biosynthesis